MPKLFISYRREDTNAVSHRIYDLLVDRYGAESVLIDTDTIPAGSEYPTFLRKEIRKSTFMLSVIGKGWLNAQKQGKRRLDDTGDPVRVEIETAISIDLEIIPLLIEGAKMPEKKDLPVTLSPLASKNAIDIAEGRDFKVHMNRLIQRIESRPPPDDSDGARHNISGVWRSSLGMDYHIDQTGSKMSLRGYNGRGELIATGSGRITGKQFELALEVNYPPRVPGWGYGQVLESGSRLEVTYEDAHVGRSRVTFARKN